MSKSRRMRRAILSLAAVSAFALALPWHAGASVGAGPWQERQRAVLDAAKRAAASQSGSPAPLVADNFQVLGQANLGGGVPNGDVWFYDHGGAVGKFAYVGTWSAQCTGQGAKVVDVNDPTNPKWEGYIGARRNSSNEDVVVRRVGGRDVLGIGVQACGPGGSDGLALFDVTNPRQPVQLSFLPTPTGVHELDLTVRADGTALALLATPYSEFSDTYFGTSFGGEFRIVDVSNPAAPRPLSDWGIIADSDLLIQGGNDPVSSSFQGLPGVCAANYAHSVRAADAGRTAYVSYWDGGILKFDISNPSAPVYLGRTIYPAGSSGDGHSMTPYQVGGTRYILQNDEDFQSLPDVLVTSSATGARAVEGIQQPWAPVQLTAGGQTVRGTVHDAGDGGQASDYAGAAGKLALADVSDPTQPERVGQFVPDTSRRHANSLGVGPAEVWGVAIDPETGIVYASDMRTGLWIVKPTGPAAP